eukprot:TRINITY_DN44217_c0_g1_i1.p1 TRINITY_DN44217_c0_g1~~TRINITY_DN44217_c0_g1_i1.p1  ORF type:complete len:295 (-),score=39.81 TRINITY_DN44217_c0_g1_i1:91-975(-)
MLTQSFAIVALESLDLAATAQGLTDDAATWQKLRSALLHGVDSSLSAQNPLSGKQVYAELRGHPNGFSEDKDAVGYSPLLWGLSYENIVPVVIGLSGMNRSASPEQMAALGVDTQKLDNTWETYRQLGQFQWVNQQPELSAFLPTTHVNASGLSSPPVSAVGTNSSWCAYSGNWARSDACPAYGSQTCACAQFAVIGKSLGWELGWAAHRQWYTRLIVLHRWLGAAAHVEITQLFGESYDYSCIKQGERTGFEAMNATNPRGSGCWGDPGNGVQIGWFLWGEALARAAVGISAV